MDLTFFLFGPKKGLNGHLNWPVFRVFGNFCVQIKAKKKTWVSSDHSPELSLVVPPFGWGAVFGKCLNFFCEQFIL